jgi:hypothetical protein
MGENDEQIEGVEGDPVSVETGAADFAPLSDPESTSMEAEVGEVGVSGSDVDGDNGVKGSGGGMGVRELAMKALKDKVTSGKSLTAAEWKRLEDYERSGVAVDESKVWAKSQVELADVLNCDRKSIQRYLKVEGNPGAAADGRYDVRAWKTWVGARGTLKGPPQSEKESLELAGLRADVEAKRLKLAEAQGTMVDLEEAMGVLGGIFSELLPKLRGLQHSLAPLLAAMEPEEAMVKMDEAVTRVMGEVAVPHTAKKKVFWRIIAERFCSLQADLLCGSGQRFTS